MAWERTFAIIKPDAVGAGHVGAILSAIEAEGLALRALRMARLDVETVRTFYREHLEKSFYPELEAFMMEGPAVLLALEGEDAVLRWRRLMGGTDPAAAAEGTLRRRFGTNATRNAVHGSDGSAAAARELACLFGASDLV